MNDNDLISRAALIESLKKRVPKPTTDDLYAVNMCIIDAPTVDAIPVEWLREKIKEHTDEEGWQDYLANSFGLCIEEWQQEQEAQDRQQDYEAAVEMAEYCERYEPFYEEDGSM